MNPLHSAEFSPSPCDKLARALPHLSQLDQHGPEPSYTYRPVPTVLYKELPRLGRGNSLGPMHLPDAVGPIIVNLLLPYP